MASKERFSLTNDFFIEKSTLKVPLANMHYHNSYELYYVINGERDYFIGDQFFKAYTNDIVLVPSGIPHRTAGKGATRILLHFTDEFLQRYFSPKIVNDLLENFVPTVLSPDEKESDELQSLFKKMSAEYEKLEKKERLESFDTTSLPLCLFELLYKLKFGAFAATSLEISDKRINEIVKYINDNYASINGIDDVAEQFFISKYHLCRIWKKTFGISLVPYVNMIKIREACNLIENTNQKITDVALECGFNSSAYFCKVFKQETGVSPREYKSIKKKHL